MPMYAQVAENTANILRTAVFLNVLCNRTPLLTSLYGLHYTPCPSASGMHVPSSQNVYAYSTIGDSRPGFEPG